MSHLENEFGFGSEFSDLMGSNKDNLIFAENENSTKVLFDPNIKRVTNATNIYEFSIDKDRDDIKKYLCCYSDPSNPIQNIGRPFPKTKFTRDIFEKYLNFDNTYKRKELVEVDPILVTAASSNHYNEHLTHFPSIKKHFPNHRILFYDLGLNPAQVLQIKKRSDIYIYRKFNFKKMPWHVQNLNNFAWKIIVWVQSLLEFGAIMYFDTSVWFTNNYSYVLKTKMARIDTGTLEQDFLFFLKKSSHGIASHTHTSLYSFFPSDYFSHLGAPVPGKGIKMHMAGGVIIYHTDFVKEKILKWAFLCALTKECIDPENSQKGCSNLSGARYLYNQELTVGGDQEETPVSDQDFDAVDDQIQNQNQNSNSNSTEHQKPIKYCHRYDQSLLSILLANEYKYDFSNTEITDPGDKNSNFAYILRSNDQEIEYDSELRRIVTMETRPNLAGYLTDADEIRIRDKIINDTFHTFL